MRLLVRMPPCIRFSRPGVSAQLASQSMGPVVDIPVPVLEKCVADALSFDPRFGAGDDALAALTRIVDRLDPSYRH